MKTNNFRAYLNIIFRFLNYGYSRIKRVIPSIIVVFSVFYLFSYNKIPLFDKYWIIRMLLIAWLSILIPKVIIFILRRDNWIINQKPMGFSQTLLVFVFLILIVFAYLPILQSKYFFYDDYLSFKGQYQNFFEYSISQSRPITGMFIDLFSFTRVENSFLPRIAGFIAVLLLFLLLFSWMRKYEFGFLSALLVAFLCVVTPPLLNTTAYTTMFIYNWGSLFSVYSVILFYGVLENIAHKKLRNILVGASLAVISTILSLMIYPPSSAVGLVMVTIILLSENERKLQFSYFYYIYFTFTFSLFFLLNLLIWRVYDITRSFRASIVGLTDLFEKIKWFITTVLPQSIRFTIFSYFKSSIFYSSYNISSLGYKNHRIGTLIEILLLCLITIFLITVSLQHKKQKSTILYRIGFIFSFIILFFYSYYFYLVIQESSFLSFYIVSLVMILTVILATMALKAATKLIPHLLVGNVTLTVALLLLVTIVSLNSNKFLNEIWVKTNQRPYEIIQTAILKLNQNQKHIHVIGDISGTDVDIYKIRAVIMALMEAGKLYNDYLITSSDTPETIGKISIETYEQISELLTNDELNTFNRYYLKQPWGYYQISDKNLSNHDSVLLSNLLIKAGLLPKNDDEVIIIDLR